MPFDGSISDAARGSDATTLTSIKALRMGQVADGTRVSLRGVVVTYHETRSGVGTLVIQDQDGGPFSAMLLFCTFAGVDCNLTPSKVDNMPIGRVIDVDGVIQIVQPPGTPTPPKEVHVFRTQVTETAMTRTITPTPVTAAMVAWDAFPASMTAGLMWQRVEVTGPLTVSENHPPRLQGTCAGLDDAGVQQPAWRGVIGRSPDNKEIAVGLRPSFSTCIFQCDQRCAHDATSGDMVNFVRGNLDAFYKDGVPAGLILVPYNDADIGK